MREEDEEGEGRPRSQMQEATGNRSALACHEELSLFSLLAAPSTCRTPWEEACSPSLASPQEHLPPSTISGAQAPPRQLRSEAGRRRSQATNLLLQA